MQAFMTLMFTRRGRGYTPNVRAPCPNRAHTGHLQCSTGTEVWWCAQGQQDPGRCVWSTPESWGALTALRDHAFCSPALPCFRRREEAGTFCGAWATARSYPLPRVRSMCEPIADTEMKPQKERKRGDNQSTFSSLSFHAGKLEAEIKSVELPGAWCFLCSAKNETGTHACALKSEQCNCGSSTHELSALVFAFKTPLAQYSFRDNLYC